MSPGLIHYPTNHSASSCTFYTPAMGSLAPTTHHPFIEFFNSRIHIQWSQNHYPGPHGHQLYQLEYSVCVLFLLPLFLETEHFQSYLDRHIFLLPPLVLLFCIFVIHVDSSSQSSQNMGAGVDLHEDAGQVQGNVK